jgi:S1-C subfamily serine protease
VTSGLLVKKVIAGSVAEQQGLKEGDVLTQIDSLPLRDPFDLIYELQQKTGGDTIKLSLQREDKSLTQMIHFAAP